MRRLLLSVTVLLLVLSLQAQQPHTYISAPRPKVGVVLGGGGAKGAAHIGVLKCLEELGVPIDYVAGTSMGSIIGGLYAIGYSPDELAEMISKVNWNEYIGNEMNRDMMSYEVRKRRNTTAINIPFGLEILSLRSGDARFVNTLPSAYVNNSSLINLFNDLCIGYQEDMDFNELPIPFACVSTDLITGNEVVIRYGNMPTAMRASMAIPGVFAPVVKDGMVLVDGGLVNNFPADVLRDMGADIIIGVEVTQDVQVSAADLRSMPQVMSRLISTSTNAKRQENRRLCNVYIRPDVSGYNMLSFTPEAIDTLVNRGYQKAQEYRELLLAIKRYIDQAAGYPVTKTLQGPRAKNLEKDTVLIRSIEVSGVPFRESRWMIGKSRLEPGKRYTKSDIERAVNLYRGTGAFDDITYTVKESDSIHTYGIAQLSDAYDLTFNVSPAKPHVLGLGIHYDTEEGTGLLLNLGLNEKRFGGSKLSLALKLSYSPRFNITYTYSVPSLANVNVAYDYRDEHFGVGSFEKSSILNLHYKRHGLNLYFSQYNRGGVYNSIGFYYTNTLFDKTSLEQSSFADSTVFAANQLLTSYVTVEYDHLDDPCFATRGVYSRVSGRYVADPRAVENSFFDLSYAFQYYFTFNKGRFTVIPQSYGRFIGESESVYYNTLNLYGGNEAGRHFEEQLPFVGFNHVERYSSAASVFRCDLRYKFFGRHYITGIYNILVPWGLDERVEHGAGLKYSFNSLMGPVSVTGQWSTKSNFGLYFSFGYYF